MIRLPPRSTRTDTLVPTRRSSDLGIPSENGTPLDAGRKPLQDAYVVKRLKQAGAVIMGKPVTTELMLRHPGKTRNPHNPAHTPGGPSSGTAAAVAAGLGPPPAGTHTHGSAFPPPPSTGRALL